MVLYELNVITKYDGIYQSSTLVLPHSVYVCITLPWASYENQSVGFHFKNMP